MKAHLDALKRINKYMVKDKIYSKVRWEKGEDRVYRPVAICTVCGAEYRNDDKCANVWASSYCPECAKKIKREKTAERVKKYRERKQTT